METITVRVGKLPGVINEIVLNGDRTVGAALSAAGLDPSGFEIRVGGAAASPDSRLTHGQTVLLVQRVKGN